MANCEHQDYAATRTTPAEYCEEEAVDGTEYCEEHEDEANDTPAYWAMLRSELESAAARRVETERLAA